MYDRSSSRGHRQNSSSTNWATIGFGAFLALVGALGIGFGIQFSFGHQEPLHNATVVRVTYTVPSERAIGGTPANITIVKLEDGTESTFSLDEQLTPGATVKYQISHGKVVANYDASLQGIGILILIFGILFLVFGFIFLAAGLNMV